MHKLLGSDGKESACNAGERVRSLGQEDPLEKEWQPTPVFLPGESHGQSNLGWQESDTTEQLTHMLLYKLLLSNYYIFLIDTYSVQSLSHVRLFPTPWTAARQAPCPSPTPGAYSNP